MTAAPPILQLLLSVALGFFLGLAFEEFYARANQKRPGGIRTFPLLGLIGALLYLLDPTHFIPFSVGLLALSAWLTCFYWQHVRETDAEGFPNVGLMVPTCNVLAYLLGPVALAEPPWVAVGMTVAAVLFLTSREALHGLAHRIELSEIVNAGRFLLLTGFALPLLPNAPVTDLTSITPRQVWLAMVAVCSVSYASYLLQRYVAPSGANCWLHCLAECIPQPQPRWCWRGGPAPIRWRCRKPRPELYSPPRSCIRGCSSLFGCSISLWRWRWRRSCWGCQPLGF
jgi:hypothetical protein